MSLPVVSSTYAWHKCSNDSTYTNNSIYSANLHGVLADLSSNAPQSSGFNTSSFGQPPNKVYGLLQCIGNISADECSKCALEANNTLQQRCPNSAGAKIWLDDCFLQYDKTNFISTLDVEGRLLYNTKNISQSDLLAAKGTTFSLLQKLIDKASDPAGEGFASGEITYSYTIGDKEAKNNFYGLVQCWRDMSVKNCTACLSIAMENLEDCCSAQQGAQALLGSCRVRYEIYPFLASNAPPPSQTTNSSNAPPPSQTTPHQKNSRRLPLILGIVGGIIVMLVGCSLTIRSKVKSAVSSQPITIVTQDEDPPETELFKKEQIVFTLETLIEATGDFDDNNKLGEGGFGTVYKGMTKDGKEIAVKKLSARSAQGKREFMNEVELVANIQHRNLVNLLGCFAEGSERLLVYEYLQNKSLDAFLFDPESRRSFDWRKRFSTINGIARGLLYLHEDSKLRIIHRDIKASNILLDEQLNPKIADFGLARLFPDNETQIHSKVAGTYGYMAPEYAMAGQLSVKVDVYSFGLLLLEIVSGGKNTDINLSKEKQSFSLVEWAWRAYKGGHSLNIVDRVLVIIAHKSKC
ncbi:hypothetical protein SUGI_0414720 [Cryptomeria japonica]|nr:hypothetical protein SUGI_0414720 [Cryptomeria japonica]